MQVHIHANTHMRARAHTHTLKHTHLLALSLSRGTLSCTIMQRKQRSETTNENNTELDHIIH